MKRVDFFDEHGSDVMWPMIGGYGILRASGITCPLGQNVTLIHKVDKSVGGYGECVKFVNGTRFFVDIRFDITNEAKFGAYEVEDVDWYYYYRLCKYNVFFYRESPNRTL
jgi:hypothetical protein